MISITHFIPLIGPFIMGTRKLKSEVKNKYFISFSPFKNNEHHIHHNYDDVVIDYADEHDEDLKTHISSEFTHDNTVYKSYCKKHNIKPTDIQLSVPPCAGLSLMNAGNRGSDAAANRWMYEVVKWFVAQDSKVLVFENAPGLIGVHGLKVMNNIYDLLKKLGVEKNYKFSVTKTNTIMHGIPQNRQRCFFYLYKSDEHCIFRNIKHVTPSLESFLKYPEKEDPTIDHITFKSSWNDSDLKFINDKNEWDFFRTELAKGDNDYKTVSCMPHWLEKYKQDKEYLKDYPKKAKDCERIFKKFEKGLGYWDGSPNFVRGRTNAIVAKNAYNTIHPIYNRYLTIRELMTLMGYDESFKLVDPVKNFNHMCQSLPVCTGIDHVKWAIGIVTKNPEYILKTIKTDNIIVLQNNSKGNLEEDISVGNFDTWKPFIKSKTSKLGTFVK